MRYTLIALCALSAACNSSTAPRAVPVARIVTFGDSNTDLGFIGDSAAEASYVSPNYMSAATLSPRSPHSLAGKLERYSDDTLRISALNHGVSGTTTSNTFRQDGVPNALAVWRGVSRFEAEVLGVAAPTWDGGTGMPRTLAYQPTARDFVYVSIGTNDAGFLLDSAATLSNIERMVSLWKSARLPASHFILTTLPPNALYPEAVARANAGIRALAAADSVTLVDLSQFTADGLAWRAGLTRDGIHYNESVRDWLAQQVATEVRRLSR